MWLTVDEIERDLVHGKLESAPVSLKEWKREQDIHIKVQNVSDWLYTAPDNQAIGGFTEKIMAEASKVVSEVAVSGLAPAAP